MGALVKTYRLPVEEIRFAAKTGFLSRPIWEKHFATGRPRWRRQQWLLFRERDLFKKHPSRLPKDVLVLHRKHPGVKMTVGEAIAMPPFAPQIEHDEMVAGIVLELERKGLLLGYRFEAEMRREEWGRPRHGAERPKYPDALLELAENGRTIKVAIEVELSQKSHKRYRDVLQAYAGRKEIKYVLFLARSKAIFENLKVAMRESFYLDRERPIGFCDLDAWLVSPGSAPIYFSSGEKNLRQIASGEQKGTE